MAILLAFIIYGIFVRLTSLSQQVIVVSPDVNYSNISTATSMAFLCSSMVMALCLIFISMKIVIIPIAMFLGIYLYRLSLLLRKFHETQQAELSECNIGIALVIARVTEIISLVAVGCLIVLEMM